MNVRGERIIVFGDSLSQHSPGATIWGVNQNASRTHSAPGSLLGSLLAEQGAAAVRVNALQGRSALNFWTREDAQALLASDAGFAPTKVVVVLGTNDVGLAPAADLEAFTKLRDAYKRLGAEVWAIGPFANRQTQAGQSQVASTMRKVFGDRFIDGRALSAQIQPGSDGIHYDSTGAKQLALAMADALIAKRVSNWMPYALGAAGVVGAGLVWAFMRQRKSGQLLGPALDPMDAVDDVWAALDDELELEGQPSVALETVHKRFKTYGYTDTSLDEFRALIHQLEALGDVQLFVGPAKPLVLPLPQDKPKKKAPAKPTKPTKPAPPTLAPTRPSVPISQDDIIDVVGRVVGDVPATGRFGAEKVFIGDVWRAVREQPGMNAVSLDTLKKAITYGNQRGKLTLARADLVSAMDATRVAESEIEDHGATFHFVLDRKSRGVRGLNGLNGRRFVHYSTRAADPAVPPRAINAFAGGSGPVGVYTYQEDAKVTPFAIDRPYKFLLESRVPLVNTSTYTHKDLDRDLVRLSTHTDIERPLRWWDKLNARKELVNAHNPFAKLWYVVCHVTTPDDDDRPSIGQASCHNPSYARDLLVGLGVKAIEDRKGVMYTGEPEQAVFLTNDAFKVVERR